MDKMELKLTKDIKILPTLILHDIDYLESIDENYINHSRSRERMVKFVSRRG